MALPPVALVRQFDTHRLVPSRSGDTVLAEIADEEDLPHVFALDAATNDRLAAARQALPGIGLEELVYGVPFATVINAAFCHAHPLGARFSGPDRGAWYAGFELETSQAEVAFHKSVQLAEIGRFDDTVTYDDYLADFTASFHDLRRTRAFRACLDPTSYVASQELADRLLDAGALGLVYPSVRRRGGTCLACFRPPLVANVRRGGGRWDRPGRGRRRPAAGRPVPV
ncbi:MAG TPA: RES family NAD+ phosphorylase, partial [Vicinamibacterales bacterium]|nr:RES family NAD+ phosphorylase [Vicinamibacterales bacterium]